MGMQELLHKPFVKTEITGFEENRVLIEQLKTHFVKINCEKKKIK